MKRKNIKKTLLTLFALTTPLFIPSFEDVEFDSEEVIEISVDDTFENLDDAIQVISLEEEMFAVSQAIEMQEHQELVNKTQQNGNKKSQLEIANKYTISQFERLGIVNWSGYKYSYYSSRVLSGGGLKIPGRHVKDGFVRDKDGYIVCASPKHEKGKIYPTPFGSYAKVYDF